MSQPTGNAAAGHFADPLAEAVLRACDDADDVVARWLAALVQGDTSDAPEPAARD
jgi:hypothetical protein